MDLRREESDPLQINHLIIQPVVLQLSADFLATIAQPGGPDEPDANGEFVKVNGFGTVLNSRTTASQNREAVPRRARI